MSEVLNYEILVEQLNTKFALTETAEPFELELVEVTKPTVTAAQTYFSLFFRGDGNFMLPQRSYQMTHERLGAIELFITPTAQDADGFKYEAVFNLLNEASEKSSG